MWNNYTESYNILLYQKYNSNLRTDFVTHGAVNHEQH